MLNTPLYVNKWISFQDWFVRAYSEIFKMDSKDQTGKGLKFKNVTFVVTEECDLNCKYCYETNKRCGKIMSKETARRFVDMLFEEDLKGNYLSPDNAKAIILEFIGGEPLREIDLIDYIVEYFKWKAVTLNHRWALYYMISMTTNGIHYNDKKVQAFLDKNNGRVSCTITIDGNKELHDSCRVFPDGRGSYDIVEKAIKSQIRREQNVNTKLTIAPGNVMYFSNAVKHLKDLGLSSVNANCVFEEGWTVAHAKIFYDQLKDLADWFVDTEAYKSFNCSIFSESTGHPMQETEIMNWCGGTGNMLCCDTEGTLFPCLRYMEYSLGEGIKPIIIGDIYNGIESTPEQKETVHCLNCVNRRTQSTDECFHCPIAFGCAWCSAYNYQKLGSVDKRATFICIMHKARVLGTRYFYKKLYESTGVIDKLDEVYKLDIPKDWALEIISEEEFESLK
jgi:uncharacterized protein